MTITVGRSCPAAKLYGENSSEAELLRRYRDEVLQTTGAGRTAIQLYYRLATFVEKMIERNELIKGLARKTVDGLLPILEKQLP